MAHRSGQVAQAWHREGKHSEGRLESFLLSGMVGHVHTPCTWEVEAGGSEVEVFLGYLVSLRPFWAT